MSPGQLRAVRWATAAWCAALVAMAVIIHASQEPRRVNLLTSPWVFLHREVSTFGLAAIALVLVTLPFGAFYGRGLAARMRIAPQARAAHMAISISALVTIVLHIVALWSGFPISWRNAKALLVPYGYVDDARFPHPIGAGALGFWLIVIFGLSYFLGKLFGASRWRIAHRFVLLGVAVAAFHSLYLSGPIPGYTP